MRILIILTLVFLSGCASNGVKPFATYKDQRDHIRLQELQILTLNNKVEQLEGIRRLSEDRRVQARMDERNEI